MVTLSLFSTLGSIEPDKRSAPLRCTAVSSAPPSATLSVSAFGRCGGPWRDVRGSGGVAPSAPGEWRLGSWTAPEKYILFCRLFELRSVNKQDGTSFPFAEETRAKARGHTGRLSRLIHRVAPWRPSPST
ncbi:hypothetical protein N9M16_00320 [Candidatus Dependentiae bacterium]|nr:hypothetical protein [Candidatus Dependentiae bacterium]